MRSAVCMAVGEFYEHATCVLLPGERMRRDVCSCCPDGHTDGEFYEIKGSGQSSWIIEEEQLLAYRQMEEEGKTVSYVLWSYRGRPTLKSICKTRRDIFRALADRTHGCWVLSLEDIQRVLGGCEKKVLGYRDSDEVMYFRPKKKALPIRPVVNVPLLPVNIETVVFTIQDLCVVVMGKERWREENGFVPADDSSSGTGVPF